MHPIEQESGGLKPPFAYNGDMINYTQLSDDYARIEQVIYYLEKNASRQPDLSEIAEHIHLSEYHFQRLFTRWVGISPKRFLAVHHQGTRQAAAFSIHQHTRRCLSSRAFQPRQVA